MTTQAKTIQVGQQQFSMMNPPNDHDICTVAGRTWKIGRNYQGLIVLRDSGECHPEFVNGMDMSTFVWWINSQLQ